MRFRTIISLGVFVAGLLILLSSLSTYMKIAGLSYLCMCLGICFVRNLFLHRALMLVAVVVDLSLVLILEFSRGAVLTVFSGELGLWELGHVVFSSCAAVLYLPQIYFAYRRLQLHRQMGWLIFVLRSLGFFLMFSLVG